MPERYIYATDATNPTLTALPNVKVIKRMGQSVDYNPDKISTALTKAMLAVEGPIAADSSRVKTTVTQLVNAITNRLQSSCPQGGAIHIEQIQDQVELALMRGSLHKIARNYVLYREAHAKQRQQQNEEQIKVQFIIIQQNGNKQTLTDKDVAKLISDICLHLTDIDLKILTDKALHNLYDNMRQTEVLPALIMASRSLMEIEPNYSYVCARLLRYQLAEQSLNYLGIAKQINYKDINTLYSQAFVALINKGIELELLDAKLADFDLKILSDALRPERDHKFTYLGMQTLYDRYLLHWKKQRLELPQVFFMRVAMGLAINETQPTERAIEFYELLSSFDYMCSTPTLFNSGTRRPQLSSCYLTQVPDNLDGIYSAIKDNALLSKWAGGLGNDWTSVRALGAHIKGTNGNSQGVIPFLKVASDTAVAVNQGGKRKGAVCAYLETWHLDIEDFLELRKNTGDERRRTHDMNTAHWIPDIFMQRVIKELKWTLFSPDEVPDLHDLYGSAFNERYCYYEDLAEKKQLNYFKQVDAVQLWRKMLSMLFETGHPWITFKDPCNIRSPQQHAGVVHSSNLCTEIMLNTNKQEIAVCNLGSVNLAQHISQGAIDKDKLNKTVITAIRMLDNVIDINYYPVPQAKTANIKHRPIGLGIMGFQDALYQLELSYASIKATHFADQAMEIISYFALQASANLAKERGCYESYLGSLWDQGVLPIDSLKQLEQARGHKYCTLDYSQQLNWQPLRELIAQQGMRNSNILAIAPTATIANIVGVSQSIEPTYQHLFVKSNLSGEFTVINHWLVKELKALGLWDEVMVNDLKYYDGRLALIQRIPQIIKDRFATAFEINAHWLVEAASRRQKWIDQGQSLNLYMSEPSGKDMDNLYKTAWSRGLKTTYYLRSLGATHMEKTTQENINLLANDSTDELSCEDCQ